MVLLKSVVVDEVDDSVAEFKDDIEDEEEVGAMVVLGDKEEVGAMVMLGDKGEDKVLADKLQLGLQILVLAWILLMVYGNEPSPQPLPSATMKLLALLRHFHRIFLLWIYFVDFLQRKSVIFFPLLIRKSKEGGKFGI